MAGAGGIRAGRAFVEIGADNSQFVAAINAARNTLSGLGASLQRIGSTIATAGLAGLGALGGAAAIFSKVGDELAKMSIRTGVSVESLSKMKYAADLSGTSLAAFETSIKIMSRTVSEAAQGSASAVDSLETLGLTVQDLAALSQEERFLLIADRISKIQDPALRATSALELFGRSGTQLLPLLNDGATGIRAMMTEADEFGVTMSTKTAKSAEEINDAFGRVTATATNFVVTIGSVLAPVLTTAANTVAKFIGQIETFIEQNPALVQGIALAAAATAGLGAAIVALGVGATVASFAMGGLASIVGAMFSPFVLVVAAITAVAVAFLDLRAIWNNVSGTLIDAFQRFYTFATSVFHGISNAMTNGDIAAAADVLWAALRVVWSVGVEFLYDRWEWLLKSMKAAFWTMVGWLESAWARVKSMFSAITSRVKEEAMTLWDTTKANFFAWSDLLNVDTARAIGDLTEEQAKAARETILKSLDEQSQARARALEAERQERISVANEALTNELAAIKKTTDARIAALDKASDVLENSPFLTAVEIAQRDLEQALNRANSLGPVGPPAPDGLAAVTANQRTLTPAIVSQARELDKFVSAGTFGGAAARGLLGPGSALGAVEKNTKATVDELRNVRRAVEDQEGPAVG